MAGIFGLEQGMVGIARDADAGQARRMGCPHAGGGVLDGDRGPGIAYSGSTFHGHIFRGHQLQMRFGGYRYISFRGRFGRSRRGLFWAGFGNGFSCCFSR